MVHFAGVHDEPAHGPLFLAELERLATMGETWATEQAEHYGAVAPATARAGGGAEGAAIGYDRGSSLVTAR